MSPRCPEDDFGFGRRLRVDWSALSWRPHIIAVPPGPGIWMANDCRPVRPGRHPVRIFRQSCETISRRTGQEAPGLKATFRHVPRARVNNSSTTEL